MRTKLQTSSKLLLITTEPPPLLFFATEFLVEGDQQDGWRAIHLSLPRITGTVTPAFKGSAGDQNSGPFVCEGGTLLTEPFPRPVCFSEKESHVAQPSF